MGNTPSVPGPDGGRLHVKRDDSDTGSDRGQRPEHSQIENPDTRLADDYSDEEVNRRRDSLSVPESYDSYTVVVNLCNGFSLTHSTKRYRLMTPDCLEGNSVELKRSIESWTAKKAPTKKTRYNKTSRQ